MWFGCSGDDDPKGGHDASAEGGNTGEGGSMGGTAAGGAEAGRSGGKTGTTGGRTSEDGAASGGDVGTSTDPDAGPVDSCEAFGHFEAPDHVFTLPSGTATISYPDVQKSFPDVDWDTLDRLYVPSGSYKTLQIGNLPKRDANHPLVITNSGGQVRVGPNDGGNFVWSMGGGSNWILTGRYDPDSKTGDVAYPGHRCGAYSTSRNRYGFISDDDFDHSGPFTHMGIGVGGGATDFEIEYVEVTRSGFAGIRLLNAKADGSADPDQPMANVRVHDTYVHDVDSEGFYFGWTGTPPSHLFPNLEIYNNRIVRTGSEALQIQDLGEGSHVHHNVFAYGALHWLDNFGKYQDGCLQILVREGNVEFDHNVSLGGAGTFLSFFSSPEDDDGPRHVTFHDNYFADTRSLGGYLNGNSTAPSSFEFTGNFFRGLDFSYKTVDPAATDPGVVFGINGANQGPITFARNALEGKKLLSGIDLNGTKANVTASENTTGAVAAVAFENSGYPGVPTGKLSAWGAKATLAPNQPDITYAAGDLVMHDSELYRASKENTNLVPSEHPEVWEKLPRPADDLRVKASSPYAAMGVR
jgi:hypothetical protein